MYDFQNAYYLGFVQGLTEFFPVSSSGHLVIMQKLLPGFHQPGVLFDVILHLGTTLAVLVYYSKGIVDYVIKNLRYLIIASIPAFLVGFLFSGIFESLFQSILVVGLALLATSLFNYLTDSYRGKKSISSSKAFVIGMFQALAIIPGISRSGSTIFAGKAQGLSAESAIKFSFILSVPAVFGASLLQLMKYGGADDISLLNYSIGFGSAFVGGLLAIATLVKLVKKTNYKYFAYYTLVLSILTLVFLG